MRNVSELLKNTVVLSWGMHAWGNRRKADISKIQTESDKSRLNVTKRLIDSPEWDAIIRYNNSVKGWINMYSVPSFFRDALALVKIDYIDDIEKYLKDAQKKQKALVEELLEMYPEQKEKAKNSLNNLYCEADYPTAAELRAAFSIDWNWISLGVAESLPNEIRQKENKKLEQLWKESISEIVLALRSGFKDLVDHAVDRLALAPGEKPKTFKDSLVPNFMEFIETFNARNVVEDKELAKLVEQAKKLLSGVTSEELRNDTDLRKYTADKFQQLKKSVDEAVVTVGRKFSFKDDE